MFYFDRPHVLSTLHILRTESFADDRKCKCYVKTQKNVFQRISLKRKPCWAFLDSRDASEEITSFVIFLFYACDYLLCVCRNLPRKLVHIPDLSYCFINLRQGEISTETTCLVALKISLDAKWVGNEYKMCWSICISCRKTDFDFLELFKCFFLSANIYISLHKNFLFKKTSSDLSFQRTCLKYLISSMLCRMFCCLLTLRFQCHA